MTRFLAPLLCLPLLVVSALVGHAEEPPAAPLASTTAGLVEGETLAGRPAVHAFRGIPYAAPPVGRLRWRPPRPPAPWEGRRDAIALGAACPQPKQIRWGEGWRGAENEDCLTLNVWTSSLSPRTKLPVMVWIHGGGFTIGSGGLAVYDGAALARRGVVLVTINYRLGPFGFLGHPRLSAESERGLSGNYGLLDQILALRWVRANVSAFGGDPGCVTIFGESAGSVSVCCLMVSPLAKGLFHRAIAQSGGVNGLKRHLKTGDRKTSSLHAVGLRLERALGCNTAADPLACLRAKSAAEILGAAKPTVAGMGGGTKYGPVVDGWVLPDEPAALWAAGKQHDVPFMVGTTADDGGVFTSRLKIRTEFAYRATLRALYGAGATEVLRLFPPEREGSLPLTVRRLVTITSFVAPTRTLARSMAAVPSSAWRYHFTRVPPSAARRGLGAAHGLEIPYVFGTAGPGLGLTETDRALADRMQRYWIQFAREGNPNAEGLPPWPVYAPATDPYLELGDTVVPGTRLHAKECDLFDRLNATRRRPR